MVATLGADELHTAVLVRFCVLPLLYVPVAVNWSVAFTAIDGEAAVTVIVVSVGGGVEVTEDPPPPQFRRKLQVTKDNARNKVERGSCLGDHRDTELIRALPTSAIPGTPI
jgi:hypothetical protein